MIFFGFIRALIVLPIVAGGFPAFPISSAGATFTFPVCFFFLTIKQQSHAIVIAHVSPVCVLPLLGIAIVAVVVAPQQQLSCQQQSNS